MKTEQRKEKKATIEKTFKWTKINLKVFLFWQRVCKYNKPSKKVATIILERTKTGQAKKSARRMPWHWEPMKDATSCDKPWGAANEH